jgi:Retroviral aspartyl protease
MFQVQIIWAPKPRLPKQGAKHHTDNDNSEVDRQIRSLTHLDPHRLHEWRRKEGLGRRRREAWFGFLKRRTASTSAPPLYIFSVHRSDNNNSFHTNAIITTPEKNEPIETQPLVDSGAGGTFMDQNYARKHGFNLTKLKYPITARNVDGTKNKQGTIQYYMDLDLHVNGKTNTEQFLITGLGNQKIILGLPWLWEHNPEINWKEGTLQ